MDKSSLLIKFFSFLNSAFSRSRSGSHENSLPKSVLKESELTSVLFQFMRIKQPQTEAE